MLHNSSEENLPGHTVACADARALSLTHTECCDLLLVNLPHESIEHLPDLLGLTQEGARSRNSRLGNTASQFNR